jgi:hypothetical protein
LASGQPTGIIAASLISGGMPSTSRIVGSATMCSVVNVVPSPRARAATRMFCAAGYSADQVNCSSGAPGG